MNFDFEFLCYLIIYLCLVENYFMLYFFIIGGDGGYVVQVVFYFFILEFWKFSYIKYKIGVFRIVGWGYGCCLFRK